MITGLTLERVVSLHRDGDLAGAEQGYRNLILQNLRHPVAYGNLAVICLETGRANEAVELLLSSIGLNAAQPDAYFNLGVAYKDLGRLEDAISSYQKALELHPEYTAALNNLAIALQEQGRLEESVSAFHKAIELNPRYSQAYFGLGMAFKRQGSADDAIAAYCQAIDLHPGCAEVHLNLGTALMEQGRLEEAITSFRRAIELSPDDFQAHFNLGLSLQAQGSLEDALWSYRKALKLKPDCPEAYLNMGNIARSNGSDNAVRYYRAALEFRPDYAEAYSFLGLYYTEQRKLDDAADCFRRVAELKPDYPQTYERLGFVLREQNRIDDAIASKCKAMELRCSSLEANDLVRRVGKLLIELDRFPVIYKDASEIDEYRNHYACCLSEASRLVSNREPTAEERDILKEILFRLTTFYLGYQHRNDRDLLASYAKLATKVLGPEIEEYLTTRKDTHSSGRIRLGIASENLLSHAGAFWAYNWLANLPRKDYEFFVYSLHGSTDVLTRKFAALGTYRWLPFAPDSYVQSLRTVSEDNLDVLLITDIGMNARNLIFSLARLAPIQCTAWGHPITSGSPNVDYFLSSELMESENGDDHYSERLVRLPKIGINFDPPTEPAQALTHADFDIPKGKTVYGSVQSLYKYLPQFDFIYPAIAEQVPNAFFVFVEHDSDCVSAAFQERLKNAFEQRGLRFEKYVKLLPRMRFARFQQLLRVLDINLDSIGWSGGITTRDSLAMACPVVALPGELMRSRLSYAMLKMIGVEELIAGSLDEYLSLSVRLGSDRTLRSSVVNKIKAQKHKLFNDKECTEYLDRFLKSKVAEVRANSDKWSESQSSSQLAS